MATHVGRHRPFYLPRSLTLVAVIPYLDRGLARSRWQLRRDAAAIENRRMPCFLLAVEDCIPVGIVMVDEHRKNTLLFPRLGVRRTRDVSEPDQRRTKNIGILSALRFREDMSARQSSVQRNHASRV